MKKILLLSLLLNSIIFSFGAAAASDRSQSIQSKIHQALGSFLEKSDYIVLVNRLDPLGEQASSSLDSSGYVKSLPGLSVGVDAKGQIVRQDNNTNQYTGPVSINILLDRKIKTETVKMINNSLPVIIGDLNDMDEIKISQTTLRQTMANPPSPVTVNNNTGSSKSDSADLLKLFAMMLMLAGVLAWLMGRFQNNNKSSPSQVTADGHLHRNDNTFESASPLSPLSALNKLKAQSIGLFLLKTLKTEKSPEIQWFYHLSLEHQKNVFSNLPAWVAAFLQKTLKMDKEELERPLEKSLEAEIYRQITVLEQNFKQDSDWKKAFVMWFPAQSLRFVPKKYQHKLSPESRKCLWHYRPDLGDFVRAHDLKANDLSEPPAFTLGHLFEELAAWPSNLFDDSHGEQKDVVDSWASMINQLLEFGSVDSQFKQAKEKLEPEQYQALLTKAANKESPLQWDKNKIKTWLRHIDPQDYFWWLSLCEQAQLKPQWQLSSELRPLRLSMFQIAQSKLAYPSWNEADKKSANLRLLRLLRSIHQGEELVEDLAA